MKENKLSENIYWDVYGFFQIIFHVDGAAKTEKYWASNVQQHYQSSSDGEIEENRYERIIGQGKGN